jgi:hypothetical protein
LEFFFNAELESRTLGHTSAVNQMHDDNIRLMYVLLNSLVSAKERGRGRSQQTWREHDGKEVRVEDMRKRGTGEGLGSRAPNMQKGGKDGHLECVGPAAHSLT